jgi:hypothetical protein
MYKTQLVTTKGETIRTFISKSRPATQSVSTMGGVEISYTDAETSFTIMGNFNVIIEKVETESLPPLFDESDKEEIKRRFHELSN